MCACWGYAITRQSTKEIETSYAVSSQQIFLVVGLTNIESMLFMVALRLSLTRMDWTKIHQQQQHHLNILDDNQ
ncbi:hypothetical protein DERP_002648 [Dermatophagoides pteronyssinus]|uniref:Uncharacterized protein n=1 Tax=Dermatophagoides pteronyssinus TaxID=6956 RepID=A0ABQ8JV91_DERPT|nr:hypothetical protein DERP_002648 [Dermatophagoides pteronyssinus]